MAQAARDPYVILISIYIFAPYFVTRVAPDPVEGQLLVAGASKWGGWAVMFTAPLLGAFVDRIGPRKPFLGAVVTMMALLVAALWFAPPLGSGLPGLPLLAVAVIMGMLTWLMAAHEMLHNALLVPAAGVAGTPRASGLGLAGGNAMSVLMLLGVLVAFALPGTVDWSWLPASPLLGLDPALGEPARITAPIVAIALLVGTMPLLLLVPDMPRSALGWGEALRAGIGDLVALLRELRGNRNPLLYLASRMVFTDGLTAILVFGGIFASGTMGWGTLEMLGYGIVLSVAAVLGGLLAGRLDVWIGPRPAVIIELLTIMVFQGLVLGMGKSRILFQTVVPVRVWDGPMFNTLPEIVFLALGCGMAVSVTAAYASSRTLLTRVVPPEKLGVYFGIYALSGYATMWLGPFLVETATIIGGTQASGFIPVIALLGTGLLLLLFVKGGGRLRA
ncbi:MFS transporter [Sandarakinorhabdus sp.]|uniref:MFS transporter n=1 Tax=Sandarakinorhabdus sp. TaxID=1916663 RepID=UPI00286E754B|nr:MFS transporter [Sandarakinorhabdus sp.]